MNATEEDVTLEEAVVDILKVTGIAGPDGGTKEQPVGLVYIGCCVNGKVRVEEFHFTGNRQKNRDYAVVRALTLLREEIICL